MINFIVLFFIIVATPYFIKGGTSWVGEEVVEGVFLTIELIALIVVFRHYDVQMRKKEEEAMTLNLKLEKKERELLNALEYLGKVNVQVSMIKSLFGTMKVPSTKNQLLDVFSELLRVVMSVTKENCARLRIVNLQNQRTVSEYVESLEDENSVCQVVAGNKELLERFSEKNKKNISDFRVFFSDVENFYLKAFLFVPDTRKKEYSTEERAFLEAIANQCEVVYLLFNSKYYKAK
ncbi:MAG: hypothetical protein U9O20_03340 [Patescibacteria group bacterium]|nr:hypothetical protein [Patescibacteria group bacterium]